MVTIRSAKTGDLPWIKDIFRKLWAGDFIVAKGNVYRPEVLEGFIAEHDGRKAGLVTYSIRENDLEIISLNSFWLHHGIGTVLLNKLLKVAKDKKITKIRVVTTNDNTDAISFYEKRGFHVARVYKNALEKTRKLKPNIPLTSSSGIPIRDEIELELFLKNQK